MNFKKMIEEALMYLDFEKDTENTVKIIKSGINRAYRKIGEEKYNLTPTELANDTDTMDTVFSYDPKILCYFAAYYFLKIDGDEEGKGAVWLNLFNDGYDNIKNFFPQSEVKAVYIC